MPTASTAPVPQVATGQHLRAEWAACAQDPLYFLDRYALIYDATREAWLPFVLWDTQLEPLEVIDCQRLIVILKARQLGLSWLVLGYILWRMVFWPSCTALVFSKREEEAIYLLSDERLRGMYTRLPAWVRAVSPEGKPDGATGWALANGSVARAFPTNAGDSYTATIALVDEADLVPDLAVLLRRVKPTVDAGGKLILLSRADKSRPESAFKRIYRAARAGATAWKPLFLPWDAHPGRAAAWYEAQRRDVLARTGSLDDLHEQYPATEAEALSPRTLDKRLPSAWLEAVYHAQSPVALTSLPAPAPALPGLEVYVLPQSGRAYVLGVDPAEGNPNSDDSAFEVLDVQTGEEVCALAHKVEPAVCASYIAQVSKWYNQAPALVERQNHGHAVLLWLKQNAGSVRRLAGQDGKEGWLTTTLTKAILYDRCAEAVRNGEVLIHSLSTFSQLAALDGNTLAAPPGQHDDRAIAFALANLARPKALPGKIEPAGRDNRNVAEKMPRGVFG